MNAKCPTAGVIKVLDPLFDALIWPVLGGDNTPVSAFDHLFDGINDAFSTKCFAIFVTTD
ncbi:hypothetical protein DC094_17405 [Pelagibaculum spongiae]|uniref:Uncharacterized protein n=1 Tax=Pelagibaculum spongiae TaxID=2080658 RepID=A0A2V1GXA5_9GAMM|nr:hypothetical protein DC094_17405 [Pelagibaculum spongiae]